MQRKSPKKGVGCTFQRTIDHGNKGQHLHFANQNTTSWLLLPTNHIRFQIILATPNAPITIHYPKIQMPNKSQK
jgi:hypothetical protein